jgi:predicted metal-dependent HD superfamily phosphohydrolase
MAITSAFQVQDADIEFLKGRWHTLTIGYSAESDRDATFTCIVQHYCGRGRVYHNLSHVKALISLYGDLEPAVDDATVSFAIWFHDIIYDTKREDNEEKSAEFAAEALGGLGVRIDIILGIKNLISATKHHAAEQLSAEGRLFLDLDLSILGAPAELYKEYSSAIRQEYGWVPGFMYRRGRRKILNDFSHRSRIFYTEEMYQRFEDQARRNLEDELKYLTR